jgi:hypothetical protein
MNAIHLCLLLLDSLDAAFRGEPFSGPGRVADWGKAVIDLMRDTFPDQRESQERAWGIAHNALWDLACVHRCDELSRYFLLRPHAFFGSIVMMGGPGVLRPDGLFRDPSKFH